MEKRQMTNQRPITPPQELVQQWLELSPALAIAAAFQAGADQELEACCEWLEQNQGRWEIPASLRAARRPKPPSLRQRALEALELVESDLGMGEETDTIRRALEQLDD